MTPAAAWDSEVFRLYLLIVVVVLGLGGLVLGMMRWVFRKALTGVWRTYRSWLVMAPLVLGVIFLGRIPFILAVTVLSILSFKEYARATGLYRDWWMTGGVYLGILSVCLTSLISSPHEGSPGWYGLFMTLPVYVISFLLTIPILLNRTRGQLQAMALAILGFIYMGWMLGHLGFLANSERAYGFLLYLLFAVALNDVMAFMFGKMFGRHPLRSQVSANKTVEGALGAVVVALVLPWVLHVSFPQFGPLQLILTGIIIGVGGQLGDLTISVIKRDIGIKDMGATIPGHGGVLDRVDSLIYTAPLFLHMVDYYGQTW